MPISDGIVALISDVSVVSISTSVLKLDGDKDDSTVLGLTVVIGVNNLETSVVDNGLLGDATISGVGDCPTEGVGEILPCEEVMTWTEPVAGD